MAFVKRSCGRESVSINNGHRRTRILPIRYVARRRAVACVIDGKHVAVVGTSPAGFSAAAHLVTLGAHVDIFACDSGSDIQSEEDRDQNSGWPVVISATAVEGLMAAGIAAETGKVQKLLGCQVVETDSETFYRPADLLPPDKKAGHEAAWITTREDLSSHILSECDRLHDSKVTVHPGHTLTGGDPGAGKLLFENAAGEAVEVEADLVVGADGAQSKTRELLQQHDPELTATTTTYAAKTLQLFLTEAGSPAEWPALETAGGAACRATLPLDLAKVQGGSQHTFRAARSAQHDGAVLTVTSVRCGEVTAATLTVDSEWWDEGKSKGEALEWLVRTFPHAPRLWLEEISVACAEAAAGESGDLRAHELVGLSKLGSGRAVLLGDAGHTVSPHLGMGCNSALEDVPALGAAVRAVDGDLSAAAAQFTAARLPEVAALRHEMRDAHAVVAYPHHAALRPAPAVPLPLLIALLQRVLAWGWNLMHRVAPGLVRSKWEPWQPGGKSAAASGVAGASRAGAWATVALVLFGGVMKVATMA